MLLLSILLVSLVYSQSPWTYSPRGISCNNGICETSSLRLKIGEEKSMEIAGKSYSFKLVNIEETPYQVRVNTPEGEKEFTNYDYKIYYSVDGSPPMLAQEASEKLSIKFDAFIEGAEGTKKEYATASFYEDKICNIPDCASQIEQSVYKKWNLVPVYFFSEEMLKKGTCKQEDITVIYAYHPIKNEYVKFYSFGFPSLDLKSEAMENFNKEVMTERILAGIFFNSVWVYSRNSCKLVAELPNQLNNFILLLQQAAMQQQQFNFAAGWNFWSGTEDTEGKNFDEIKGTCNIEKAYTFDANSQSWKQITNVPATGTAFVFKTTNKCMFGYEQPAPPSMPQ